MKKIFLLLTVMIFWVLAFGNHQRQPRFKLSQIYLNGFRYSIDPRIELKNAIGIALGIPTITPKKFLYKEAMIEKYAAYKNHRVITYVSDLAGKAFRNNRGWGVETLIFFMLHLDLELNYIGGLDSLILKQIGGDSEARKLAKEIKRFALETDFYSFYNSHSSLFNLTLANVKENFTTVSEKQRLEDFYGTKKASYNIILNLLEGNGNFGLSTKGKTGEHLYAVLYCQDVIGNIPAYSPQFEFYYLIYHEFSHSYCNPLVYSNGAALQNYQHLFEPIRESLTQQGYNNWLTAVHEHLVRSVTILLAEGKFGKEISDEKFFRREIGSRFIYVKPLRETLRIFQNNRKRYRTFSSFFPQIIKAFSSTTNEDIALLEKEIFKMREPDVDKIPMPSDAKYDSTMIFVIPTHEKGPKGDSLVKDYALKLRGLMDNGIKMITDDEALDADLSAHDLLVLGTKDGNSFLKRHLKAVPVLIDDDKLVFDQVLPGKNYQVTISWLHPQGPKRVMIIHSAQQAEDIKNYFYSAHKSAYHYWIGRNGVTVTAGNFARIMKIWTTGN